MTPDRFQKLKAALTRRQPDLTILAEHIRKPHNFAALVRTCDAVGIYEIHTVASRRTVQRHHNVAGGSWKWVQICQHPDTGAGISEIKNNKFQIIAAHISDKSIDYRQVDYTRPTAVLLGSELAGVSKAAATGADQHVAIPMRGMVTSLNVSVANALILYEAARQREEVGMYDTSRLDRETFDTTLFEWCYPPSHAFAAPVKGPIRRWMLMGLCRKIPLALSHDQA